MTLLDAGALAFILLVAAGGYKQGFIRGVTRLSALVVIALLTSGFSIGLDFSGSVEVVVLQTLALFGGGVLIVTGIIWLLNRAVPARMHTARLNKALGVVPAVVQSMIILALVLGFAQRVALEQTQQQYIARGLVTGPLIQPFAWFEQTLAGVR